MKKFFSSVWFKCITCLLLISLISGGLLSILNDVLYVSSQERTDRAIKSVYGEIPSEYETVLDIDANGTPIQLDTDGDKKIDGEIQKVFTVGDTATDSYEVIIKSTGFEGYKDGSISIWALVKYENGNYVITKVIMETFKKQTLMSNLGASYYDAFLVDVTEAYENGENFTASKGTTKYNNPVSGATFSANAGNNAVNCIIEYLGTTNIGGVN